MNAHISQNNIVRLFGCPFDVMTMDTAMDQCLAWCERRDGRSRIVVTLNAALLAAMRRDATLRDACLDGDMIVADGLPVVWVSRLVRRPLPERVAGVDMMANLLEEGARRNLSVYLLGAKEEVVSTLVEQCRTRLPGLRIAGYRNGYFGPDEHPAIIEDIRASDADILFVGMPSPFKETWLYEHRDELGARLLIGVGGSFDVLSGFVPRAPQWMQRIGMEWSWRLIREPRRMWKRYLVTNSQFMAMTAREMWQQLRHGDSATVVHDM